MQWQFFLFVLPLVAFAQATQTKPSTPTDDPGPPVLKRGGNAPRKAPKEGPDLSTVKTQPQPEADAAPAPPPAYERPAATSGRATSEDLIERAREVNYDYNSTLPNFLCDQITTRYTSEKLKPEWKKQDRVEVELMYVDGREDYRNIRINGKPLKKGSPEDSGSWSTGDFGTILVDVLRTTTDAEFKKKGTDTVGGVETTVYDFKVLKPNSHWTVRIGSAVKPAYQGSLYIDSKTARVMRIEMRTKQLPANYPVDTVETTTEYGWVTISNEKFLLPVLSQNLACQRDTFYCTRNDGEYKNYRRFTAESSISNTDSSVTFEGEDKVPPPSATPEASKKKTKKK